MLRAKVLHLVELTGDPISLRWIEVYEETIQEYFEKVEPSALDYWHMFDQATSANKTKGNN